MSDKQNRFKKQAPALTVEEQATQKAARLKAAEELEKERQRIELYGKSVEKMSHRQLRAELKKAIKREHAGRPPEPQAGLPIAFATIFLNVLDNTVTSPIFETHANGAPKRMARFDQLNPAPGRRMVAGW